MTLTSANGKVLSLSREDVLDAISDVTNLSFSYISIRSIFPPTGSVSATIVFTLLTSTMQVSLNVSDTC